jgi:hypothetical protein
LGSTDVLQVVPTACYRPAIQQLVSDNIVATASLQLVDKFAASLFANTSC